jgi:hypothetical protein
MDTDLLVLDEHFFDMVSEMSADDMESSLSSGDDHSNKKVILKVESNALELQSSQCGGGRPLKKKRTASPDSDSTTNSEKSSMNKEYRLIRNRESANKCRQKKKNELRELTLRVGELLHEIGLLKQENAGLRADNTSLTDHNSFLRRILAEKLQVPIHSTGSAASALTNCSSEGGFKILGVFGAISVLLKVFSSASAQFAMPHIGGRVFSEFEVPLPSQNCSNLFQSGVSMAILFVVFYVVFFSNVVPKGQQKSYLP